MPIRDLHDDDLERAFAINETAVPDVDAVSRPTFDRLCASSVVRLAALDDHDLVGFCLVVAAGSPDPPERAAVALDRPDAMWHLERVAFAPGAGGRGLGPQLYDEIDRRLEALHDRADDAPATLTSWFSVEPLNQHALEFYRSRGFVELERRRFADASVALMQKRYRT